MTAREFAFACYTFRQFGKIKDIDFDYELFNEVIDPVRKLYIRSIDFEDDTVVLGTMENFGCDCCGSYFDEETYDLDDLARGGYLDRVIDMLNGVLDKKGIGC
jgi:hypothetical protein